MACNCYFLGTSETEESQYSANGSSWSITADLISDHNRPCGTDHNEDNGDLPVHYTPDKSSSINFARWQLPILRNAFLQTDGYIDMKTLINLETQLGAHRSHINVSAELSHPLHWHFIPNPFLLLEQINVIFEKKPENYLHDRYLHRPHGKVMFSQVFVCPQSASWLLAHCSALLRCDRYASY